MNNLKLFIFFESIFRILGVNMKIEVNKSDNNTRIYVKENISKKDIREYIPSEIIYNKLRRFIYGI